MNKRDTIINELEKEFGIECDVNEEFDVLCDGDTCRHDECQCWADLALDVRMHLEEMDAKQRKRGSLTVYELREALDNAGPDDPVFINGEPIFEAWSGAKEFYINTDAGYTAKHQEVANV